MSKRVQKLPKNRGVAVERKDAQLWRFWHKPTELSKLPHVLVAPTTRGIFSSPQLTPLPVLVTPMTTSQSSTAWKAPTLPFLLSCHGHLLPIILFCSPLIALATPPPPQPGQQSRLPKGISRYWRGGRWPDRMLIW